MSTFWSLPGPARFVDRLESDIRAGFNLVVQLTPVAPQALAAALAARVGDSDLLAWRTLDLGEEPGDLRRAPAQLLADRFVPSSDNFDSPLRALVESGACAHCVVWVHGLTETDWPTWSEFLAEFDHLARNHGPERMRLCLVPDSSPDTSTTRQATVRWHRWRQVVGRLDMTLYVWDLHRDEPLTPLHRQLRIAVITELSGGDERLARRLSACSLDDILDPRAVLLDEAARRQWTPERASNRAWQNGMVEDWDGRERLHSCAAAVVREDADVRRRVWAGQVATLFPFIEEQRMTLLPELTPVLRLPYDTPFGPITHAHDLELGHLLHQARVARLGRTMISWLECLRSIRHALAHLEPVTASILRHPELLRRLGPGRAIT